MLIRIRVKESQSQQALELGPVIEDVMVSRDQRNATGQVSGIHVKRVTPVFWAYDRLDFRDAAPRLEVVPSDAQLAKLIPSVIQVSPLGSGGAGFVWDLTRVRTRIESEVHESDGTVVVKLPKMLR